MENITENIPLDSEMGKVFIIVYLTFMFDFLAALCGSTDGVVRQTHPVYLQG